MSKSVLAILLAALVTASGLIAATPSSAQGKDRPGRGAAAFESGDSQFGVVDEIDVRGLSGERKAALISGLPVKLGEPISKGQCKQVGDYVRSFDKQFRAAFIRVDDKDSKAVIIVYRAP